VAQRLAGAGLLFALVCGVAPLMLLGPMFAGVAIVVLVAVRAALGAYFVHRLGGYTGDCLGMAQQCGELSIYLVAAAWTWS
jgi:adenosylcobinamide-GDP ribazoletransferase